MRVQDSMIALIEVIDSEATVSEASKRLGESGVQALVVKEATRFAGVLTDRDVTRCAFDEDRDLSLTSVSRIMRRRIAGCYEDLPLEQALDVLKKNDFQGLLVFNRQSQLQGVLLASE